MNGPPMNTLYKRMAVQYVTLFRQLQGPNTPAQYEWECAFAFGSPFASVDNSIKRHINNTDNVATQ